VLIAEDDRAIQMIVADYLRAEGFDVDVANNGAEALALAHRIPPAIAVVDMFMPVMNGHQLLAAWSQDRMLNRVPVIVVSAAADLREVAMRYAPGTVRATLSKPFDLDALSALVEGTLRGPAAERGTPG
jgi:DNA-binding response OmpR family regulator